MSALPALCGVGGTFKIDGIEYRWSPLTIGDMAEFESELRQAIGSRLDVLAAARDACNAARLKDDDRRAAMEVAAREHLRLRMLGPFQLVDEVRCPDSDAILLRQHLRKNHPDLSIEEVRKMLAFPVTGNAMRLMIDQARAALPGKDMSPQSAAPADSTSQKNGGATKGAARTGRRSSATSTKSAS